MMLFFSGSDMWACGTCGQNVGNSWKRLHPCQWLVLLAASQLLPTHQATSFPCAGRLQPAGIQQAAVLKASVALTVTKR